MRTRRRPRRVVSSLPLRTPVRPPFPQPTWIPNACQAPARLPCLQLLLALSIPALSGSETSEAMRSQCDSSAELALSVFRTSLAISSNGRPRSPSGTLIRIRIASLRCGTSPSRKAISTRSAAARTVGILIIVRLLGLSSETLAGSATGPRNNGRAYGRGTAPGSSIMSPNSHRGFPVCFSP